MAADQTPRLESTWKHSLWVCLLLAVSTLLVYWPVTGHDFVNYDDTDYVTANPYVHAGLSAKGFAWVWHSDVARNWHPVTMLSHMLDCQLYGMRPGGHHLTSLLFHIVNTLLLFLLLRGMTGCLWRSGIVAALFALHPLHVESVAWVAERKDVLSTFFFLLTLLAYGAYADKSRIQSPKSKVQSPKPKVAGGAVTDHATRDTQHASRSTFPALFHPPALLFYVLSLLLFALGLMSKPMLVTVPFVLLLLDYWPLQRLQFPALLGSRAKVQGSRPRVPVPAGSVQPAAPRQSVPLARLLWEKLPFLLLCAASCVVTFRVQQSGGSVLDVSNLPVAARVANALMSYVRYLGKMVWPENLAALYVRKTPWLAWEVGLAAIALLAVSATVIRLARRQPYLAVGWFWYVGTLVPVIGLVQVGMQSMADRYTYIPLIGIFIAVAWGIGELTGRWRVPKVGLGIATAVVLAACVVVTRKQIAWWKSSETLFQRMITAVPGNYMAHYNMGNLYSRQDKLAEAVKQYESALKAEPNYAEAHNNLGSVLLRQGRFDEAVAHYSSAVRLKPEYLYYFNLANAQVDAGKATAAVSNYQQALRLNTSSSQAHHNLGMALQAEGKGEAAMAEFRAALQLQPDYESAEHNLANRLADAGRLEEAMTHYLAALRLDPKHAETYNGLGICYAMQGKFPEAERQFREAVRLKPDHAGAQSNLGNALGAQNKLEEAIPHYQKALEIDLKDFQTHFNLGVSLLRQGRRGEARNHFMEALRLHPDYPEARKALAALDSSLEQKK
jgi:tetratricopeptide (TPR) repeat protein